MLDRVLLYTGGLDSTIAWHLLGRPVRLAIDLHIGIPEGHGADLYAKAPWPVKAHLDGHIPLRNLHLVSVGALYADRVLLGAVKGESSPDKSRKFMWATSAALTAASQGRTITVEAPLRHLTKAQAVAKLIEQEGEAEARSIIRRTRSCYSVDKRRCGECMACFRRWVALSLNGIYEEHSVDPWTRPPPTVRQVADYMRWSPIGEWPGIIQTNVEAVRAKVRRSRTD